MRLTELTIVQCIVLTTSTLWPKGLKHVWDYIALNFFLVKCWMFRYILLMSCHTMRAPFQKLLTCILFSKIGNFPLKKHYNCNISLLNFQHQIIRTLILCSYSTIFGPFYNTKLCHHYLKFGDVNFFVHPIRDTCFNMVAMFKPGPLVNHGYYV